MSLGRQT